MYVYCHQKILGEEGVNFMAGVGVNFSYLFTKEALAKGDKCKSLFSHKSEFARLRTA